MRQILINAKKNAFIYPSQRRHNEILKKFSTALFIYCGPLAYDFLQQNMSQGLPSLRTVQRIIHAQYKTLHEGVFRFDELLAHITDHNAPKIVSIGEDATRVIGRVDYDSETNQCVGFVLPLDVNGLPVVDAYLATSFTAIEAMFNSASISKYAYIYMAQPLASNIPPLCLACLGSDQKFTAQHVLQRWQYIYSQCAERGIKVASFGGDGDSRIMKAMRVSVSLSTSSDDPMLQELSAPVPLLKVNTEWNKWFCIRPTVASYVQDVVHIAVKLKSRLLNPSVKLKLGPNFEAGAYHLQQLCVKVGKEQHFLRAKDLNHKDRQNFDAVQHIINACPLLQQIPGSFGTKCYVEIIKNVVDSYLDKSLNVVSRLEKIWHATFFVRYWRKWILLNPMCTIKGNFISHNCYMCIELNAHALITYVLSIRDHFQGDFTNFLPWLLGSQTCERTFRTLRSMSSTFSTVLNFSILGMLRRLHRLNIQLTLQSSSQGLIKFPNVERHRNKEGKNKLPKEALSTIKDEDITEAIQKAKTKARSTLEALGMDKLLKIHSIWDNESTTDDLLAQRNLPDDNGNDDDDIDNIDIDCESDTDLDDSLAEAIIQEVCLDTKDQLEIDVQSAYSRGLVTKEGKEKLQKMQKALPVERLPSDTIPMFSLKEHNSLASCLSTLKPKPSFTPFVEVTIKGHAVLIRKTTAVWLFQETERVSADRLFRVRLKQPFGSDLTMKNTLAVEQNPIANDDKNPEYDVVCGTVVTSKSTYTVDSDDGKNSECDVVCNTAVTPENTYAINKNSDSDNGKNSECDVAYNTAVTPENIYAINQNSDSNNGKNSECDVVCNTAVTMDGTCTSIDQNLDTNDGKNPKCETVFDTVTIINDNGDNDTSNCTQVAEICTKERHWLKIGCYSLNFAEKEILCNKRWLSDLHINAVQVLLKQQYPQIGGLQNVLLLQSSKSTQHFPVTSQGSLQVVRVNNSHWIVVSTLNCCSADVTVYDSLYSSVSMETQLIIARLLKTKKESFTIQIAKVNKQAGYDDCGVFAAAYCTSLAFGYDPTSVVYDQDGLRHHMLRCLENKKMTLFPIIRNRRATFTYVVVKVYCDCRCPYTGQPMVACSKCKRWFHIECLQDMTLKGLKQKKWYCSNCSS